MKCLVGQEVTFFVLVILHNNVSNYSNGVDGFSATKLRTILYFILRFNFPFEAVSSNLFLIAFVCQLPPYVRILYPAPWVSFKISPKGDLDLKQHPIYPAIRLSHSSFQGCCCCCCCLGIICIRLSQSDLFIWHV